MTKPDDERPANDREPGAMRISGRAFSGGIAGVPPTPRVPSARARRAIFKYQGAGRVSLFVGGMFTAIGLVFAAVFCRGVPGDLMIEASARPGTGRTVEAQLDRSTSINDQHPTVVRFEYTVDGRHYEQSSSGLDDRLLALAPGQALPIEISRWNPELARVSGTTRAVVGYGGLFVLLFPLIGLTLLGLTVRARRRAIRAFVHGRPVTAAVTFTGHDRSVEMNGRNPFKVAWQFLADDGRLYTGALSAMDPTTLEMLANAVEIVVLYDPANPRANTAFIA